MKVCNYCVHHPYCHGKEWCANFTDDKNEADELMEEELSKKLGEKKNDDKSNAR